MSESRARAGEWTRWIIQAATGLCLVFCAALLFQLARRHALTGRPPRRGDWLYPDTGPVWLHLLVNHISVSWTSRAADTIAPLALITLAAWTSRRWGRPGPLIGVLAALTTVAIVVTVGKGFLELALGADTSTASPMAISGPATATPVVLGLTLRLIRHRVPQTHRRSLRCLAAAITTVIGVTQLYLGHKLDAVVVSTFIGAGILTLTIAIFGPTCTPIRHIADAPANSADP